MPAIEAVLNIKTVNIWPGPGGGFPAPTPPPFFQPLVYRKDTLTLITVDTIIQGHTYTERDRERERKTERERKRES